MIIDTIEEAQAVIDELRHQMLGMNVYEVLDYLKKIEDEVQVWQRIAEKVRDGAKTHKGITRRTD